jgi:thiol-disulfide isomerase/thioredoxin
MRLTRLAIGIIAVPALLAVSAPASGAGPKVGARAPLFTCPLLGGDEPVTLKDQVNKGSVTVLSFFHTTCKPCLTEIPRLTRVVEAYKDKGVSTWLVFVGAEDSDTVRAFLRKNGFSLPVLMDRQGLRIGEKYGVVADGLAHVPQIAVIGRNGTLKALWKGLHEGMEERISKLLDESLAEEKAAAGSDQLTLLFTNNTNGMTLPAMATELGGLARRATVIARERAASPSLVVVDCGDFLPPVADEKRSQQLVDAYARMGYNAVAIGEAEFVNGLGFLRKLAASKKVPLLSANVKICRDDVCSDMVRSSVMVEAGKYRVGVFSYMHPDTVGFTPEARFKDDPWYIKFVDYTPMLKGFLESYRKECDLLVVLSHAGIDEDRRLAAEVPGIDVIVGGHSQTFMGEPAREGKTLIVHAGADGQFVGKMVMKMGYASPMVDTFENIQLSKAIPEDEAVKAIVSGKAVAVDAKKKDQSPPENPQPAEPPPAGR